MQLGILWFIKEETCSDFCLLILRTITLKWIEILLWVKEINNEISAESCTFHVDSGNIQKENTNIGINVDSLYHFYIFE